jgi:hypothetical protein
LKLLTRHFPINLEPTTIAKGNLEVKEFTWNSESTAELPLLLNAAAELEDEGWTVGLECPVGGVQRTYRIPVFAVKDDVAMILKPTTDSKKVNVSGIKMLEIRAEVEKALNGFSIKAVVLLLEPYFDERRRSSSDYEVWLKGS